MKLPQVEKPRRLQLRMKALMVRSNIQQSRVELTLLSLLKSMRVPVLKLMLTTMFQKFPTKPNPQPVLQKVQPLELAAPM
jgi:hypothetical protein